MPAHRGQAVVHGGNKPFVGLKTVFLDGLDRVCETVKRRALAEEG